MTMEDRKGSVDITAEMAGLSLPGKILAKSPYEYPPLPSNRHIHVLQILPRPEIEFPSPFWLDSETIHCTIKTFSLDEKPEFDALSYTWGNPITVYENEEQAREGAMAFEQTLEIVCNGKPLNVTANLYDALLAIREVSYDYAFTEIVGRPRAEYIWIDSICINQNDTAE